MVACIFAHTCRSATPGATSMLLCVSCPFLMNFTCWCLQERNPRGYQYMLQLGTGAAFLGSSPEQLYARSGSHVASEAVAATRARGSPGGSSSVLAVFGGDQM